MGQNVLGPPILETTGCARRLAIEDVVEMMTNALPIDLALLIRAMDWIFSDRQVSYGEIDIIFIPSQRLLLTDGRYIFGLKRL